MYRQPPSTTRTAPLFPYTTLFRSPDPRAARRAASVRFLASAQQREEFGDVDVAAFVGEDAEHRTRARHDLAHHWGRGPARGALARTIGVALGLVDHHEDDIARIVHREGRGEGRDERMAARPEERAGGQGGVSTGKTE